MRILLILIISISIFTDCLSQQNNEKVNFENEFEKALAFMDNDEYYKSENILLELNSISSEAIGVKMNLSVIERLKGNKQKAIKYLEEALEINPNHPPVVRLLRELTGEEKYEKQAEELESKIVEVTSEQYFKHFQEQNSIVNSEYANFDIKMVGEVVSINKEKKTIYLKGTGKKKETSVICINALPLIESFKEGEKIEFIGNSFGIGDDSSEPIIVFKRKVESK